MMYSQKKEKKIIEEEYKYWTEIDDDYITYRAPFFVVYARSENFSKPSAPEMYDCTTNHAVMNGHVFV